MRTPPESLLVAASRGGDRAVRIIGYEAAAYTYGLDAFATPKPAFIVPHGTWRRGPFDHQRRRIDDIEVVELDGLLITSVRQTLADLCSPDLRLDLNRIERAIESALRLELVGEADLREFAWLFAYWRHGTPRLAEVLDRRRIGAAPTGSDLETRCLQVMRAGGIPDPIRQMSVYGELGWVANVDFGWWATKFVVEVDGTEHHKTPKQVLNDNSRQNAILDAGHDLRRFAYRHIVHTPRYVVQEVEIGLTRAGVDLSKIRRVAG